MAKDELPQVDIVSASFNSAQHLPRMIESVLQQDYPKVSLFVQDGGSTDETLKILRRYDIQWASESDSGISQALNRAIRATHGDIIGFTSSDDLLTLGAVSTSVEVFRKNPDAVMVYGDCNLLDTKGQVFRLWKSKGFDLDLLFWDNFIPFQTVFIRRKTISE